MQPREVPRPLMRISCAAASLLWAALCAVALVGAANVWADSRAGSLEIRITIVDGKIVSSSPEPSADASAVAPVADSALPPADAEPRPPARVERPSSVPGR